MIAYGVLIFLIPGTHYAENLQSTVGVVEVHVSATARNAADTMPEYTSVIRYTVNERPYHIPTSKNVNGQQATVYYLPDSPREGHETSMNYPRMVGGGVALVGLWLSAACGYWLLNRPA